MEIRQKLLQYKYHILALASLGLLAASLVLLAPRFLTVLAYFWPLLLSTALFLVAVVVFGKTSPVAADPSSADKAGEGILDYVAGRTEQQQQEEEVAADAEGEDESLNRSE